MRMNIESAFRSLKVCILTIISYERELFRPELFRGSQRSEFPGFPSDTNSICEETQTPRKWNPSRDEWNFVKVHPRIFF